MGAVINRLNKSQGTIGFHHCAIGFHVASPAKPRLRREFESHEACVLWFQIPMIDLALPLGHRAHFRKSEQKVTKESNSQIVKHPISVAQNNILSQPKAPTIATKGTPININVRTFISRADSTPRRLRNSKLF
jgi:hypothetical protein